jgi:hypothetical protein
MSTGMPAGEVDGIWRGPELTDEQRARLGRSA